MAVGHVTLDDRQYMLATLRGYRRSLANQMSIKTTQGETKYSSKDAYDSWVQSNWAQGVGRRAEEEGFLYAELDSRVPMQLTLPALVKLTDGRDETGAAVDMRNQINNVTSVATIGAGGYDRIALYWDASAAYTLGNVWVYARIPLNVSVNAALHAVDGSDKPTGAVIDSDSTAGDIDMHFRWHQFVISESLTTENCLVLYPSDSSEYFEIALGSTYTNAKTWVSADDGSTWTAEVSHPFFLTDVHKLNSGVSVTDVVTFNGATYAAIGTRVYKYSVANENWTAVGVARSTTITDLDVWESVLYIGLGDSTNHDTMSTLEAYSNAAVPARLFARGGAYFWRAVSENVYYSTDGSTWSSALVCGPSDYKVRGMAQMGDYLHVATDDGLYYIAPGDIPVGISPWPGVATSNGKGMIHHMGTLYSPVLGGLYEYTQSGALRNIWAQRIDDLPSSKLGQVVDACAMSNWAIVAIQPDSAGGASSVWAWQEEGWHFLASLPNGLVASCVRYDRANSRLWVGTTTGLLFWFYVSDHLINPTYDSEFTFQPFGWLETGWFSSAVLEDYKDFDGIYIKGRGISSANPVDAWWLDDDSSGSSLLVTEDDNPLTTEAGSEFGYSSYDWQYLGQFTSDRQEIRWDMDSTARTTKELKLGLLLRTNDRTETPRVEAVRVKYHLMVTDWNMFNLPLLISGTTDTPQQLLDNTANPYTREQQRTHIKTLETQVPPFVYSDIDGNEYEVKIRESTETIDGDHLEYYNGAMRYDSIIAVTLEQVTAGTYSG